MAKLKLNLWSCRFAWNMFLYFAYYIVSAAAPASCLHLCLKFADLQLCINCFRHVAGNVARVAELCISLSLSLTATPSPLLTSVRHSAYIILRFCIIS